MRKRLRQDNLSDRTGETHIEASYGAEGNRYRVPSRHRQVARTTCAFMQIKRPKRTQHDAFLGHGRGLITGGVVASGAVGWLR
jgi:hypothetical protein